MKIKGLRETMTTTMGYENHRLGSCCGLTEGGDTLHGFSAFLVHLSACNPAATFLFSDQEFPTTLPWVTKFNTEETYKAIITVKYGITWNVNMFCVSFSLI